VIDEEEFRRLLYGLSRTDDAAGHRPWVPAMDPQPRDHDRESRPRGFPIGTLRTGEQRAEAPREQEQLLRDNLTAYQRETLERLTNRLLHGESPEQRDQRVRSTMPEYVFEVGYYWVIRRSTAIREWELAYHIGGPADSLSWLVITSLHDGGGQMRKCRITDLELAARALNPTELGQSDQERLSSTLSSSPTTPSPPRTAAPPPPPPPAVPPLQLRHEREIAFHEFAEHERPSATIHKEASSQ
jgi:hypothetical protein